MQTTDQVAGEAQMTADNFVHKAVCEWIRDDAPVAVRMTLRPEHLHALVRRVAALRAQPERGAEEWNYDMSAAPTGQGCSVLVSVPAFAEGHAPFVGEAYFNTREDGRDGDEGWWWAGTSPGDYWASPIREVNAEPIAWRHLPEPAAIRALPLPPAKDEGGGR